MLPLSMYISYVEEELSYFRTMRACLYAVLRNELGQHSKRGDVCSAGPPSELKSL